MDQCKDAPHEAPKRGSSSSKRESSGLLRRVSARLANAVHNKNPRSIVEYNNLQMSWIGSRLDRDLKQANEFLNEGWSRKSE